MGRQTFYILRLDGASYELGLQGTKVTPQHETSEYLAYSLLYGGSSSYTGTAYDTIIDTNLKAT